MKVSGDEAGYEAAFKSALFKTYLCRVRIRSYLMLRSLISLLKARIKQESVNDEMRVKSTVLSVQPINYVQESRNLLEAISKYN
jgi:replication factor A1